jgi:hypothetical protein
MIHKNLFLNRIIFRHFSSKKNSSKKVIGENQDAATFSFDRFEKQMKSAISHFQNNLEQIRIGRANPAILDKVVVTVHGKRMLLPTLSQIHTKDSHTLMVVLTDEEVCWMLLF